MAKTSGGALQGFFIGLAALTALTVLAGGAIFMWNRTTQDFAAAPAEYNPQQRVDMKSEVNIEETIDSEFARAADRSDHTYHHRLSEELVSQDLYRKVNASLDRDAGLRVRNVQTRFENGQATIIAALDSRLTGLPPQFFVTVKARAWAESGKVTAAIDEVSLGNTKAPDFLVQQVVGMLLSGIEDKSSKPATEGAFFVNLDERFKNVTDISVADGSLTVSGLLDS